MNLDPLAEKWESFGWAAEEVDGHDISALWTSVLKRRCRAGVPSCLVAHTVKGKGVSFMEGQLLWHYRSPQGEEYEAALAELESRL